MVVAPSVADLGLIAAGHDSLLEVLGSLGRDGGRSAGDLTGGLAGTLAAEAGGNLDESPGAALFHAFSQVRHAFIVGAAADARVAETGGLGAPVGGEGALDGDEAGAAFGTACVRVDTFFADKPVLRRLRRWWCRNRRCGS